MVLYIAGLVLILTIIAIIKNYDSRLVLFSAGVIMCILGGNINAAFAAFIRWAAHPSMVPILCTVVGFTYITAMTKCDEHFVQLMSGLASRGKHLLIPITMLVSYIVSLALPSAAGAAAAVGALLVPLLTASGIHPVIAGAAVFAGTWGDVFSPGSSHNILIAQLAKTDVMTVIFNAAPAALVSLAAVIASIIGIAIYRGEYSGYVDEEINLDALKNVHPNPLKAIMPLIPLVLILLSSKQVHVIPWVIPVPAAMLYGTILCLIVCRTDPSVGVKEFFKGMGHAYTSIVSILMAAGVFAAGMTTVGLTQALIAAMKETQSIARIGATFGPFVISLLSGSGIAGSMAFNNTITPHAPEFGMRIMDVGSVAFLTGGFGRSMSPVAAAAIVCAGFGKCSPVDIVKRTAPGMIAATLITMVMLLF